MQELILNIKKKSVFVKLQPELIKDLSLTFFFAFSMIMFEIFLTRLFAVIFDYNYVFLVISLATLGIGIGGYFAYQFPILFRSLYPFALCGQGVLLIGVTSLIYLTPFQGITFYSILSTVPFLFTGYILASIFQKLHTKVHVVYFIDLVGASLGASLAILLMNHLSPIPMISMLSLALFLVGSILVFTQLKKAAKVMLIMILALLMINIFSPFLTTERFLSYQTSPYTTFSEQEGNIIYSEWDSFSRTDVYDAKDGDFLYMTIDGGAVSSISRFDGDLNTVDYLQMNTSDLAFQNPKEKERALIIGSGGGQEVLSAEMAGYSKIEALDINKGSFNAVHSLRSFAGDVFERDGVETIVADGRNYIRETTNTYDLIFLSLVTKQSDSGLGLALTENFIYTNEALRDYFNKLKENGQLSFLLHDEKELAKVIHSAESYYQERGIPSNEIKNHIAVVGSQHIFGHVVAEPGSIERPLLILKKHPFTEKEATKLFDSAANIAQLPLHVPYRFDHYKDLANRLHDTAIPFKANRDAQPFFFHKNDGIPSFLWIGLILISLGTSVMSLIYRKQVPVGSMVYFSGIGIGFMLIQVTLIQRLTLPLGHPTWAFVIVLTTLLISGGIGSAYSTKWKREEDRRFVPILLVAFLTSVVYLLIHFYYQSELALSTFQRTLLVITMLIPVGFFIGMPFPYGMSRLKKHQISISWGINGLMTVAGSIVAAMLSLTFGMNLTIIVGIVVYLLLFIFQPLLKM